MDVFTFLRRPDPAWHAMYRFNPGVDNPVEFLHSLHYGVFEDGFPMPSIPEVKEFEESMEDLADQITSDYDKLREIIQYRDHIMCVWVEKMTIKDRQTMLESILGTEVPRNHRPDLTVFLASLKSFAPVTGVKLRPPAHQTRNFDAFCTPQINLEDLCNNPRSMILFIDSRAANSPVQFWRDDLERGYLGRQARIIIGPFLPRYTVTFHETGQYARLEALTPSPTDVNFRLLRQHRATTPGEASIVLRAQSRIYRMLREWCEQVLGRYPPTAVLSPSDSCLSIYNYTSTNIHQIVMEEPYKSPADIDFTALSEILQAKADGSRNHLLNLRENPRYFVEHVGKTLDHH